MWNLSYDNGADIVLVGHAHVFNAWLDTAKDTSEGTEATGLDEFVVGMGGHEAASGPEGCGVNIRPTEEDKCIDSTSGALKLSLFSSGYSFEYIDQNGSTIYSGNEGVR